MLTISKSSFIRGMQCPKSLYLHFFQPELRDEISETQQALFDTGHSVGEYAQQLFPGGIDASRGEHGNYAEALAYTQELIRNGQKVIYEAAFGDGETLCYMDILIKKSGKWHAYEVKASTQVKDYHVMDVAFQYFVITRSGMPLQSISLIHLNNQYVRRGELDIPALFTIETQTDIILPLQDDIPGQLGSLQKMLSSGKMPEIAMGRQCNHPFNCDFIEFCSKSLPETPEARSQKPEARNQTALDDFKANLEFPLFFMDFETIMPAIPLHDESRPYQQIPFQYSLHIIKSSEVAKKRSSENNSDIKTRQFANSPIHKFYLGAPPSDPRPEFIETLLNHLGSRGSILVWNQAFEMTRLREIARDYPKYSKRIEAVLERIVDLMVPFRKKHLYVPEMNGSYSLKAVLPTLIPDLSYETLEIQEGGTASLIYESLYYDTDPGSIEKKRNDLLEYCKLDTLSMVRILGVL